MQERSNWPFTMILLGLAVMTLVEDATAQRRGRRGGRGNAEARALAEPLVGVTTDGKVVEGLFSVAASGVSTEPVKVAAEKFLASLTEEQRVETMYPIEDRKSGV